MSRKWIPWVKIPVVIIIGFVLSTLIDPYMSVDTKLAIQAVDAVVPLIVLFLFWGLSGRAWVALLVEILALSGLRYADHVKVMYLNTDLVYADFTVLKGFLSDPELIFGFLHFSWELAMGLVAIVVVAVAGVWVTRKSRPSAWPLRVAFVAIAVAGVVCASVFSAPAVIHSLDWEVFQQARGAKRAGVAGNILLGAMTSRDVNHKADPAMEKAFWKEPLVQRFKKTIEAGASNKRPDIIIVQSESLFMVSQLEGFSDTSILKRITSKDYGHLKTPVFGGRTLQTEFEVQTGAPIAFFPGSMFAYYELLHHRVDALPHVLDRQGYKTLVIHPNARGFWNRDAAMPEMGFATFQDIGSFMGSDHADHGHVSDLSAMRAVLSEIDASDRPTYVTAITMDNHGPWGDHVPKSVAGLGLPDNLTGVGRDNMADYVSRAKDADKSFGYLIDALKRRKHPAIVAIYGDHLPALPEVYNQLKFKDGKLPTQNWPPYRIWANFPIETPPPELPAYLLQGFMLRQAGMKMTGHVLANAIAGMVETGSTISDKDRHRILEEYDNIAAANLQTVAGKPDPDKGTLFVGHQNALETLKKIGDAKVDQGSMSSKKGDMYLRPDASGVAKVSFKLRQHVASVTLRPYVPCMLSENQRSEPSFAVHADGKLIYKAYIGPRLLSLATFNLRNVKDLNLTVRGGEDVAKCGVYVRVAQMLKCSETCVKTPGYTTSTPARILRDDPTQGDVKALSGAMSSQAMAISSRMANLRWLLSHEIARHKGLAPIKVQSDAQLFMHPADDHDSWIKFDVSGLASIDLTPRINTLGEKCKSLGPKAAVAAFSVQVDGKSVINKMTLDRNYHEPVHIDLKAAHTLRVDVNKGNEVSWCDWVSVGADHLGFANSGGAPAAAGSAANTPAPAASAQ